MPVPITLVDAGGFPITETPLGTPMTPTNQLVPAITATPATLVDDGGLPVVLVNVDLTPYEAE